MTCSTRVLAVESEPTEHNAAGWMPTRAVTSDHNGENESQEDETDATDSESEQAGEHEALPFADCNEGSKQVQEAIEGDGGIHRLTVGEIDRDSDDITVQESASDDEPLVAATREAQAMQSFLYDQRGLFLEWMFSDKELSQMLIDRQLERVMATNVCDRLFRFPRTELMDTGALLDAAVEAALDFQDMFELANARLKRMSVEKAELKIEVDELKYWGEKVIVVKAELVKRLQSELQRSRRREEKLREVVASLQHALNSVQGRCMEYELRDTAYAAHSRSKEEAEALWCRVTELKRDLEAAKATMKASTATVVPLSTTPCMDNMQVLATKSIQTISVRGIGDGESRRSNEQSHSSCASDGSELSARVRSPGQHEVVGVLPPKSTTRSQQQ